jgi:hypothetical protein
MAPRRGMSRRASLAEPRALDFWSVRFLDAEGYRLRRDEVVALMRVDERQFSNAAADLVVRYAGPSKLRAEAFRLRRRHRGARLRLFDGEAEA